MRALFAAVLLVLLHTMPTLAVEPDEILKDPALETRARELSQQLRCMVCQNQSIDDSAAPLAHDLRVLVRDRLKSGGVVIDPAAVGNVGAGAEHWERVVRKLRTRSMPPPGAPRPDAASYDRVATFLETELDRAEAARPHLGKLPLTHRLSRTEYRNAVRDLLALESLPREVSIDYLLPPDNISSGFDNIADLLFISPSNMERYLDAARKISRLAIGDPSMPVMVNIHRLDPEHPQDERVDELPFGTRGGIAVRSEFPVDGMYIVKVDVGTAQGHDDEHVTPEDMLGERGFESVLAQHVPVRQYRHEVHGKQPECADASEQAQYQQDGEEEFTRRSSHRGKHR